MNTANNDESRLDDLIRSAIRDVPRVDSGVREQHIAAALAELSGPASRSSTHSVRQAIGRRAVAAAIAVLLAGAGFALGRAGSSTGTGLAEGSGTSVSESSSRTDAPVKGNAPSGALATDPTDTQIPMVDSPCNTTVGLDPVARYRSEEGWRIAYIRDVPARTLLIVDEKSCTVLQEIDLP